jgi:hypothetical protein
MKSQPKEWKDGNPITANLTGGESIFPRRGEALMTKLTENFSLEELVQSEYAVRHGIKNTPTNAVVESLRQLATHILQPLRDRLGQPIGVTSGYRSVAVNSAIGGAAGSQHIKGEAADINCPAIGQQELFRKIRESGLPFDQLIDEFGSWVHVSYSTRHPSRRDVLKARKVNGVTKYTKV